MLACGVVTTLWAAVSPITVAQAGSAIITQDATARTWTVSSAGATLTLRLSPTTDFAITRFGLDTGQAWVAGTVPDTTINVGTESLPFGKRAAGFVYVDTTTVIRGKTVQLDTTFDLPASRLRVTRHYAATSGSPTFETWTTFTPLGAVPSVRDLNAFHLTLPTGRIRWVNGLRGEAAGQVGDGAFTLRQKVLQSGERLVLGAAGRSSEQTVPWFTIDGPNEVFYAGVMWSGAWSLTAARTGTQLDVSVGLAPMTTSLTTLVDGPHAFFGVARGDAASAASALRPFIIDGLRRGRPIEPLVTLNTWFAYGVNVDADTMEREIDLAAALGAELFVLDAGWHVGAGQNGTFDFASGLGTWKVDPAKFPDGLRSVGAHARRKGMKFGLWVEPENVAQSTVGGRGLVQEPWLATAAGTYGSDTTAQVCLGGADARQWLTDKLIRLIDTARPDYLKWDNNMWLNCDRAGHGHGTTDGNFAHVNGLYALLAGLRDKYPTLLIENVSGGGNRLDLGMLRYTDAAWMDDMSTPAAVVRHNIQGLSAVFPPAYLLSFVMEGDSETLHESSSLTTSFRSRMLGVLGMSLRVVDFSGSDRTTMRNEIRSYKELRGILTQGTHRLLTPQAGSGQRDPWDAVETWVSAELPALLWAFQTDRRSEALTLKAVGLTPEAMYDVQAMGRNLLGQDTGALLMSNGLEFLPTRRLTAQAVLLRPSAVR